VVSGIRNDLAVNGYYLMLYLTLSCRSTWAPPNRSSRMISVCPWRPAHMRALQPNWGSNGQ